MIPETLGRTLEEIKYVSTLVYSCAISHILFDRSFMMEAGVPTREWKDYDLQTAVALNEKTKQGFRADAPVHREQFGEKTVDDSSSSV